MPDFILTITKVDGKLFNQANGPPKFEIFPTSETEFFFKVVNAQITFNKNASGNVNSITLHQAGRVMQAPKKPKKP